MDTIRLMHAKLHQVIITECRPDYMGSLGIDEVWMRGIGLLPLEEDHCWNVTRGTRFTTYAIAATERSHEISPDGAWVDEDEFKLESTTLRESTHES